jgi:hypothetical protein
MPLPYEDDLKQLIGGQVLPCRNEPGGLPLPDPISQERRVPILLCHCPV